MLGRVVDEHGAPLSDVRVSLYPVGARWSNTTAVALIGPAGRQHEGFATQTRTDGRFRFETPVPTADWIDLDVEPDAQRLFADRRFGRAPGHALPSLVAGDNDVGDIVSGPAASAQGRVVAQDGTPIADARVAVSEPDAVTRTPTVQTDAQGHFLLGHLALGRRTLRFDAEGWIAREDVHVEVSPGSTVALPDIVLARAFAIAGRVVDESGAGLPGIRIRGSTRRGRNMSTPSKPDGAFTLYLDENVPCRLDVDPSAEFEAWKPPTTPVFEAGTRDVRIELRRRPGMTFKVIDARTRQPIERFGLRLDPKPEPGRRSTANEAEIPLADHPRGEVRTPRGEHVVAWALGHAPLETDVVIDAGEKDVQTLALLAPAGVHGRLVLDGKPLAHAILTLQREGIDAKRTFALEPGVSSTSVHYDVGEWSGRKRTVSSNGAISPDTGATDPRSQGPGSSDPGSSDVGSSNAGSRNAGSQHAGSVNAGSLDVDSIHARTEPSLADEEGSFTFSDLAAGTYALQIDGPGAARKRFRGLELPAETVVELGDVVLAKGATIRGVVVAEAGGTPEGISVRLDGWFGRVQTIADVDGRFEFNGLEAGNHVLTWSRPTQRAMSSDDPHAQTIALEPGDVREVVLDASASTPCDVIVHLTRGGRPAAGVLVSVEIKSTKTIGNSVAWTLGISDAQGTVEGKADGDLVVGLVAMTPEGNVLGQLESDLALVPGGRIERTFDIALGRLVVELPPTLDVPEQGLVRAALESPAQERVVFTATTPAAPRTYHASVIWRNKTIDFGAVQPGTYDATVTVQRFEPSTEHPEQGQAVDLREPYKTHLVIEPDHETKIVVP